MRATMLLVLAVLALGRSGTAAPQGTSLRAAVALGQTHDDALYASFSKSYSLSPTGTIEEVELITEFRRAVLLVRDKAMSGDYAFREPLLEKALVPYKGLVTILARVRLHPMNTFVKEPAYDLYISTGPRSAPISSKGLKRESVYAGAPMGSPLAAVRLEASFSRADISAAASPTLIITDEKADIMWQARLDLSRYR